MHALRVAFARPDKERVSHGAPPLTGPRWSPPGRPKKNKKPTTLADCSSLALLLLLLSRRHMNLGWT